MAERALKNCGAGYSLVSPMYPGKLTMKTSRRSVHTVTFQTDYKDTQLHFHFDESFPSRIPKVVVSSPTLTDSQKLDLCELLQRKGKAEEYTNTLLLPILLEHAVEWLKENYGKKPSENKTLKRIDEKNEIRGDAWQLSPSSGYIAKLEPGFDSGTRSGCEAVPRPGPGKTVGSAQKKTVYKEEVINKSSSPVSQTPWSQTVPVATDAWTGSEENWNSQSDDWSVVKTKAKPKAKGKQEPAAVKFTMDTVPHISVPKDTRKANYFIAIRCTNDEIGNAVEDVVKKMLEVDPVYKDICYNRNEVHVTLTTVALHTEEDIKAAVKALEDAKDVLINNAPTSCLTISGMDNFQGGRVVYGGVKVNEDVLLLRKVVRWAFLKAGISPRDNYDYTPHMTLVKVNVPFERKTGLKTISRTVYESLMNTNFGKQGVTGIHLCKMGHDRRADGFYICPTQISLKK